MSAPDRVWAEVNALPVWQPPEAKRSTVEPIPFITERCIRLQSVNGGKCPTCGDRYHGCPCEDDGQ